MRTLETSPQSVTVLIVATINFVREEKYWAEEKWVSGYNNYICLHGSCISTYSMNVENIRQHYAKLRWPHFREVREISGKKVCATCTYMCNSCTCTMQEIYTKYIFRIREVPQKYFSNFFYLALPDYLNYTENEAANFFTIKKFFRKFPRPWK